MKQLLKILGDHALSFNTYLKSITIPSSVTFISSYTFSYSSNLQKITFKGLKEPQTCATNAFPGTHSSLVINVPSDYEGDTFCGKTVTKSSN